MAFPLKPRAILVDVISPHLEKTIAERRLRELESLTQTYGGIVVVKLVQKKALPHYQTYIGSGKLEEIIRLAKEEKVDLLILNNLLKPKQMFHVGELLRPHGLKAWDRVDLILKIFDHHAKTAEAKLQIKLAAIRHMGPRIFGMGLDLMQQGGGIGARGLGETNTEIMKRHLAGQEKQVRRQLDRIATSRDNHRKRRDRLGYKTVSIVGYTNAGKSSLLNALTRKKAHVADALFATLDTRVGKLHSPAVPGPHERAGIASILLSDTIGFIQDLPPQLIDAFRSTLDETVEADLLLHVIDVSDPYLHEKIQEVERILSHIGVDQTKKIYVFNKMDLLLGSPHEGKESQEDRPWIDTLTDAYIAFSPVFVSSVTGEGLEALKRSIAAVLR